MLIATGVVIDFGTSDASVRGDAPSTWAIRTAEPDATVTPTSERDDERDPVRLQLAPLLVQRDRERDGRRPEQEVHELRPVEIGPVRRARAEQDREQQARSRSRPG